MEIRAKLLAKNTILNILGQGLPLLVAFFAIPIVIRELGEERFGILALTWIIAGQNSNIFELGLGRTVTKFVAESLSYGDYQRVPVIVWHAVLMQTVFGLLGSLLLLFLSIFATPYLRISATMQKEAIQAFLLLAPAIPLICITSSFRGLLEAAQRFDLVNFLQIPFSIANFLLPLIGLWLGYHLPGIIVLSVVFRVAAMLIYFLLCWSIFPSLQNFPRICREEIFSLIGFGGWLTAHSITAPILLNLERILISAAISAAAVTHYTVPFEIAVRLCILSTGLGMAVFPVFSSSNKELQSYIQFLFLRSSKYLILVAIPIFLPLVLFAEDILTLWLGPSMAQHSTIPLQILIITIFISLPAPIAIRLLQGQGHPDLYPKINIVEFPIQLLLAWLLIQYMGIAGAAIAMAIRCLLETIITVSMAVRILLIPKGILAKHGMGKSIALFSGFSISMFLCVIVGGGLWQRIAMFLVHVALYLPVLWLYAIDDVDKEFLLNLGKFHR